MRFTVREVKNREREIWGGRWVHAKKHAALFLCLTFNTKGYRYPPIGFRLLRAAR